ncbi:1-deoxy-D-xylulose-5-phosphate synthase [Aeromonas hydrophila]|uniref:1-deoxy-D-xylulose-5-phosphate synthase n=1 Tax=Aeromonas hydrophila subsp. hydrophila (strain ATCC 7966 / DSM 30187 / BCRC 13018 / CCUG 14551 / JCM 1027 / KCTC 2358 / NCIMB 9240 / NCTC 8049) TaxID=380703 RepID=DXS_AERHH|nr:1-deoxy-D-xylulose-5-phosphate synthase [Aeromonas hydrophila]A0KNF9.1 RecName: Full=1-deoxy-D-xylulose-5-phosphate synthase; AltName: Full=1-deoxyxylulose-5-phosphate synthase; Short=DXP synthase; Short=DXPS [Aeromonas hydrophila subsp. hydrophila ATCC 7966]ABK37292.1 1-deoxy-D-xylulose-5-phosphate synthase [Aeromonas hydrophila subsp. hydrophila ATCC 7966]MBS4671769.1 1-deoxy-D-xylulose-5-phosphate synthase [Aeromonas hydrophila]OOD35576.1 1-deoxy-D-xylulose-5-phosphate synthase [Aeromonas
MSVDISNFPNLALADTPVELRSLPFERLPVLCNELREYLLRSVSRSSGHLASGLGTVELTVALHYVYNTPFDRLVWDVGHQAYPHKILTGRRDRMQSIRQKDGLHPFPWRGESEYDVLSVGHSSTSIGAALGMAVAAESEGLGRKVVAVIGDGAITAGMAFEALNHAGDVHKDMLVVLNDNEMSISENVGALNNHLARIMSGKLYTTIREGGKKVLAGLPPVKELAKRAEEHLKGMVVPGTLFEEFGFNYIGPIDGHDINALVETLRNMRNLKGPQLLHVKTKKGKGYEPAEKDPIGYHGVPKFNPDECTLPKASGGKPSFSAIFGQWLCDMAAKDERLVGITPAMREGSGLVKFSQQYPDRYFDVAIAEQHAVTFAAGLAIADQKPVVAIYSSFLQRAYDQLIHDVALQELPVLFAIDRAGLVGADGPTHQGAFDISFLRTVPNMVIMTPSDENECRQMLYTGYQCNGPAAVRYPRGSGTGIQVESEMQALALGKGRIVRQGKGTAILAFGTLLQQAKAAAEALDATLVDMRFVKPMDEALVFSLAATHDQFVTLEDNAIMGGAGSAVNELLMRSKQCKPVLNLGLPDRFVEQGTQEEIYALLGLDGTGIQRSIEQWLQA